MRIAVASIVAVTIMIPLSVTQSTSQVEEKDSSEFDRRVESIVNDIFHRFDRKFGTSIFTEEPYADETASDSAEACGVASLDHPVKHQRWSHPRHRQESP